MNVEIFITKFSDNRETIRNLVGPVGDEQARWKPSPKTWSILEVINHLHDEEKSDFRLRLEYLLHRQEESWPPIDPEGWVTERAYNEKDPGKSLELFCTERQNSLSWLKEHTDVDWNRTREHPRIGVMHAGDLLASWLAHDYLHMRQLVRLHYLYADSLSKPYSTAYAGGW